MTQPILMSDGLLERSRGSAKTKFFFFRKKFFSPKKIFFSKFEKKFFFKKFSSRGSFWSPWGGLLGTAKIFAIGLEMTEIWPVKVRLKVILGHVWTCTTLTFVGGSAWYFAGLKCSEVSVSLPGFTWIGCVVAEKIEFENGQIREILLKYSALLASAGECRWSNFN